jgi:hypothetical protein
MRGQLQPMGYTKYEKFLFYYCLLISCFGFSYNKERCTIFTFNYKKFPSVSFNIKEKL